jgi:hypothetical protein
VTCFGLSNISRESSRDSKRLALFRALRSAFFGVLEHLLEWKLEDSSDLEGHLQRWRVPSLFDGDDGLAGQSNLVCQFCLGHLPVFEAKLADGVGDFRGFHAQNPRRYTTSLTMEPESVATVHEAYRALAIQNGVVPVTVKINTATTESVRT